MLSLILKHDFRGNLPINNSGSRATIFHMLIGLDKETTTIDFRFTRLKAKVTRVTCKKVNMVSVYCLENYLSQRYHISHADWG